MDWLNYHQLLNFWHVAEEGSVQKASEVLHVTPASVSAQVKQLEKSLGVQLLRKEGRGVVPTDVGEQVADYAREIFATGQELVQFIKANPLGRPVELRVGIRDSMPKLVACRLLQPVFDSNDRFRVVCQEGELNQLVADLVIHKLDVVLSDSPIDPNVRVQAYSHLLSEEAVAVMGSPKLAEEYAGEFPRSLDGAPFLLPTTTSVLRRGLDQWFYDNDLTPHVVGEFADSAMIKATGRFGAGLFAVPTSIQAEVEQMYSVRTIGVIDSVRESSYAIAVERKLEHPGVLAIREAALSGSG